ncbi:flagellar basal body rod protein [Pelotomaculum thermopropionicum SI]|uniref:Flagellar basal-body rod protein FlgC n=1 Tax=Pelotomaculum thermopropionicum (strain DSM 13744 / JCM 10971 / SI) TaxID=370438 RepID=A5D0F9_PELTS|nr:flagellar basal body rod protein [Pelotomaculum thermopropionicum SI]
MGLFDSFAISASGLTAERLRLDLISNNIANMNTAGRPDDPAVPAYRRRFPVFAQVLQEVRSAGTARPRYKGAGVRVIRIVEDHSPPRLAYEPSHPLADERGYVAYPNINIVNEMINMITATRSYEANVTALNAAKDIALKAIEIGRG